MVKSKSYASSKGKRAERKVRDELKRIYPPERRSVINRVPMSGASPVMKGDVIDMNDTNYAYEVKCQEKLCLPEWWRQTVSQAMSFQIPVLVFTSSYRPLYWAVRESDWMAMVDGTIYSGVSSVADATTRGLYDKLSSADNYQALRLSLGDDSVCVVSTDHFIEVRKDLYNGER